MGASGHPLPVSRQAVASQMEGNGKPPLAVAAKRRSRQTRPAAAQVLEVAVLITVSGILLAAVSRRRVVFADA